MTNPVFIKKFNLLLYYVCRGIKLRKGKYDILRLPLFRSYRFAGYKQFLWWIHNELGKPIGILKLVVTFFYKIREEYLGTWKFAKTWKFSMGICLFKVNNRNTKERYETCSKLRIKTPQRRQWRGSDIFILNSEDISHHVLVLLLLTLSM